MSRIKSRFVKWGTGADDVNSQSMPANFTPLNYTPAQVGSEGNDKVSAHLNGIDSALAGTTASPGDLSEQSFTAADNQATPANITGLAFANGTVRSFEAIISIVRGSTYAQYKLNGIQRAADWTMDQSYVGDVTGLTFTITTAGQIQYVSTSTGNTATVKFRAISTSV